MHEQKTLLLKEKKIGKKTPENTHKKKTKKKTPKNLYVKCIQALFSNTELSLVRKYVY